MCANLPVNDPAKITVPTIIMRGQYDASPASTIFWSSQSAAQRRQGFAIMPDIAHGSFTR